MTQKTATLTFQAMSSRVRGLREALSTGTIALEVSSRNACVTALQKRWDRLRAGLELVLDQRAAEMADLPGGESGMLVRGYKGKETDRLVTRIGPGVVSLVAELRGHERRAAEKLEQWKTGVEESRDPRIGTLRKAAKERNGIGPAPSSSMQ